MPSSASNPTPSESSFLGGALHSCMLLIIPGELQSNSFGSQRPLPFYLEVQNTDSTSLALRNQKLTTPPLVKYNLTSGNMALSRGGATCHLTPGKTTRVLERGKCEPSSERHWMDVGEFRVAKACNSRKRK